MANETKRGQGDQDTGGKFDKDVAEKEWPGYDVDPNKESPTRKDAGQGGSQRDQGGFEQPDQGQPAKK